MIELRELQNLLSLDEHRHFGRAAEAIGISQSALSKSLQRLEKVLGVTLIDRSRAGVVPTSIGREVIDRAKHIALGMTELQRSVDLLKGLHVGTLAVGVGPAMAESYVTQALAQIADAHPTVRIQVRVDRWSQLLDWLIDGEIDLVVADIADASADERLECAVLPPQPLVWFCRAGHPLASRSHVTRGDLLDYPLATPRMPPWAVEWFAAVEEHREGAPLRSLPTIECENYAMLKRIVLASNSISAGLATTLEPELATQQLMLLPVDAPLLTTHAGIVHRRDRTPSPLATEVIHAIESLASRTSA